jgi:hypothetical protein
LTFDSTIDDDARFCSNDARSRSKVDRDLENESNLENDNDLENESALKSDLFSGCFLDILTRSDQTYRIDLILNLIKTYRIDLIEANADAGRDEKMNEIENLLKRVDKSSNSKI